MSLEVRRRVAQDRRAAGRGVEVNGWRWGGEEEPEKSTSAWESESI